MVIFGRKAATVRQKKRKADSSDDEDTVEPSSSKKAKVSAIVLTLQPSISEPEPMDATSTGKAWVAEEILDTMG
jgi:hypothetical protein